MKFLITTLCFLAFGVCQAQEKHLKTYFVKTNDDSEAFRDKEVKKVSDADFIRTISSKKNDQNLFEVNEYYLDKTLKLNGNSSVSDFSPKYEGIVVNYSKAGTKRAEEQYLKGRLNGPSIYYFPNGTVKKRITYDELNETPVEINDSLGNPLLDESRSGTFKIKEENGDIIEGTYTYGKKDKSWKTTKIDGKTYVDEYENGKYIKGKTTEVSGKLIHYTNLRDLPTFPGGMKALASFLSQNLRYPPRARDNGTQGKVFLNFIIEKDGSLEDIKVIREVGDGCDEEAVRVMQLSPKWNPGKERGKEKSFSYTMPIYFKLSAGSGAERSPFDSPIKKRF